MDFLFKRVLCPLVFSVGLSTLIYGQPVAGTLAKHPDVASVCIGVEVLAILTPGSGGNGTDELEFRTRTGVFWSSWLAYVSGNVIATDGLNDIEIRTRRLDSAGAPSGYHVVSWAVNPNPMPFITPVGVGICAGADLDLTGNPGGGVSTYTHLWAGSGATSLNNSNITNPRFYSELPGDYFLSYTVTDLNGCSAVATTTITVTQADNAIVTNSDTGKRFCTIQVAIDDPETLSGHTLAIPPSTYTGNVNAIAGGKNTVFAFGLGCTTIQGSFWATQGDTLQLEINGTESCIAFSQLRVTGSTRLSHVDQHYPGAALKLHSNYLLRPGEAIRLIDNQTNFPTFGKFASRDIYFVGDTLHRIYYSSGTDNNDVALYRPKHLYSCGATEWNSNAWRDNPECTGNPYIPAANIDDNFIIQAGDVVNHYTPNGPTNSVKGTLDVYGTFNMTQRSLTVSNVLTIHDGGIVNINTPSNSFLRISDGLGALHIRPGGVLNGASGFLDCNGPLTLDGILNWNSSQQLNLSGSNTINATGTLNWFSGQLGNSSSSVLNVNGSLNLIGNGSRNGSCTYNINAGGQMNIEGGGGGLGTVNIRGVMAFIGESPGSFGSSYNCVIHPGGSLVKNGSNGAYIFSLGASAPQVQGTVSVNSGILNVLTSSQMNGATYTIGPGAALQFHSSPGSFTGESVTNYGSIDMGQSSAGWLSTAPNTLLSNYGSITGVHGGNLSGPVVNHADGLISVRSTMSFTGPSLVNDGRIVRGIQSSTPCRWIFSSSGTTEISGAGSIYAIQVSNAGTMVKFTDNHTVSELHFGAGMIDIGNNTLTVSNDSFAVIHFNGPNENSYIRMGNSGKVRFHVGAPGLNTLLPIGHSEGYFPVSGLSGLPAGTCTFGLKNYFSASGPGLCVYENNVVKTMWIIEGPVGGNFFLSWASASEGNGFIRGPSPNSARVIRYNPNSNTWENAGAPASISQNWRNGSALSFNNTKYFAIAGNNFVAPQTPTLSDVVQIAGVCSGDTATFQLTGLRDGAQTIGYEINGQADEVAVTAVGGVATFTIPTPSGASAILINKVAIGDCEKLVSVTVNIAADIIPPALANPEINCTNLGEVMIHDCLDNAALFDGTQWEGLVKSLYLDNCDNDLIASFFGVSGGTNNSDCVWTFIYEYRIEDHSGNATTCTITRSGGNATPPTLLDPQVNAGSLNRTELNLCAGTFDPGTLTPLVQALYTNECNADLIVTLTNTTPLPTNTDCSWLYVYQYTVEDQCGNTTTCEVSASGGDNAAPTLLDQHIDGSSLNQAGINQCNGGFDPLILIPGIKALYTDNCNADLWVALADINNDSTNTDCFWTATYTYKVRDLCGNLAPEAAVVYSGGDTEAPAIFPDTVTGCFPTAAAAEAAIQAVLGTTDNCSIASITDTTTATAFGVSVTVTATDACNNSTSVTFTSSINDTPPLTVCPENQLRITNAGSCTYTITGVEFNPAITIENCPVAHLSFTASGATMASGLESLDGMVLNVGETSLTWFVTDHGGDTASCSFMVAVMPPLETSGYILREHGFSPLDNTTVVLNGANTGSVATSTNGEYALITPLPGPFTISPKRQLYPYHGVDILDVKAIRRHVTGASPLAGPYKLIAADTDQNNSVSDQDAEIIRQALLGNPAAQNVFETTSWRFIPAGYHFPDPSAPWGFPETVGLQCASQNINFIGVKIGDVNSSNIFEDIGSEDDFSVMPLTWDVDEQELLADEKLTVRCSSSLLHSIAGWQFALRFDPKYLSLEQLVPLNTMAPGREDFGQYQAQQGELRCVWAGQENVSLRPETALFDLHFQVLRGGTFLSEVLRLDDDLLRGFAFSESLEIVPVKLKFNRTSPKMSFGITSPEKPGLPILYQNRPSPFDEETFIRFDLPEDGEVLFTVRDAINRVVYTLHNHFTAGTHEVMLSRKDIRTATGVLYYTLRFGDFTDTKRMVIADNK